MEGAKPIIPLFGRYASKGMRALYALNESTDYRCLCSPEMRNIFSEEAKFLGWRRAWVLLAEYQHNLGLPVTEGQVQALKKVEKVIDIARIKEIEREKKHDVMSAVQEYAEKANQVLQHSGGRIHLGATSCDITDNEELYSMKNGLTLLSQRLVTLSQHYKSEDLLILDAEIDFRKNELKARGLKGATGTQASFLELFKGDHEKVQKLDQMFSKGLGFRDIYAVTGQTYNRLVDYQVLSTLAAAAHGVLEVLQVNNNKLNDDAKEMEGRAIQAGYMASNQWLERSLDDSSERRIIITESFYQLDHMINKLLGMDGKFVLEGAKSKIEGNNRLALDMIIEKTATTANKLHEFAVEQRDSACIGYTHGQIAQPTTYGKRLDLWSYGMALSLSGLEHVADIHRFPTRTLDYMLNLALTEPTIAAAKMATDIRILQHDAEVFEPFGNKQKGSSAMPHKRNPMKCERLNGLARNKIGTTYHELSAYDLLNTDAVLEIALTILTRDNDTQQGFTVNPNYARTRLVEVMPFLSAEHIMMANAAAGADRQELHEKIRLAAIEARRRIDLGQPNQMIDLMIEQGINIDKARLSEHLNPDLHLGRSREQVDEFGTNVIVPLQTKYKGRLKAQGKVEI